MQPGTQSYMNCELQSCKFSTAWVLLNFCRMQYESVEYRAVFWLFFSTTICPKKCLIIIISFYKEQVQAIKGPLGKLVHTYTEIKLCWVWVWCFLSFKQHTGLFQKESTVFFSKMKQNQLLFKGQIARPDRKIPILLLDSTHDFSKILLRENRPFSDIKSLFLDDYICIPKAQRHKRIKVSFSCYFTLCSIQVICFCCISRSGLLPPQ